MTNYDAEREPAASRSAADRASGAHGFKKCAGHAHANAESAALLHPELVAMARATSRQCPMMPRERTTAVKPLSPLAGELPRRRPARHRTAWLALAAIVVVVAARFWPVVGDSGGRGLSHLDPLWIAPAVTLAAVSMLSAAMLQRRVLRTGGLDLPISSMMAINVAGNALSVTLPLAGSTAGTAFTYLQLKRRGADLPLAGWTLAMSGIISTSILAVLLGLGVGLSSNATASIVGAAVVLVGVIPIALLVAALRWPAVRRAAERMATAAIQTFQRLTRRGRNLDPAVVPKGFERVAGFRLGWRAGASAAGLSVVNWTADIACLAVCVAALGAPVPWTHLALVYAAALGAASLSLTPAGIGIVETAVAVALIEFGTPAHLAIVAALMYRAISCWLVLALGWASYVALRRSDTADQTASRAVVQPAIVHPGVATMPLAAAPLKVALPFPFSGSQSTQ